MSVAFSQFIFHSGILPVAPLVPGKLNQLRMVQSRAGQAHEKEEEGKRK